MARKSTKKVSMRQLLRDGTWTLLAKDNVSQLASAHKHNGLWRLNVDHHDAATEFPVLKHVWEQTETLRSVCARCLHAAKLTVQSCLLILIWATLMQTCSQKLYSALLHKQKLSKDWLLCGREKLWSSKKQHRLVFYYTVFLQWPSASKQLSSWAVLALTSRPSLMSSICKKTGGEKKSLWSEK